MPSTRNRTLDQLLAWFAATFLSNHTIDAYQALPLGQENTIQSNATRSLATGYQSRADHHGAHVHSAGQFASRGDAQAMRLIARNTTDDNAATPLYLDGASALITIPQLATWQITANIVGRRTDATNEAAGYVITATLHRDTTAASTRLVGTATVLHTAEDTAGWDATLTADTTNGALTVNVRGENDKNINWVAVLDIAQTFATV